MDNIKKLINKADKGDVETQFKVGKKFDLGIGVKQDKLEAFKYYKIEWKNFSRNRQGARKLCYKISFRAWIVSKRIQERPVRSN